MEMECFPGTTPFASERAPAFPRASPYVCVCVRVWVCDSVCVWLATVLLIF